MKKKLALIEKHRLTLQDELDATKTQAERNRMGQFATPSALALDILSYARKLLPRDQKIRFIDPAFGTGSFYSALLRTFPTTCIENTTGIEIDPHYAKPAIELWKNTGLKISMEDFTSAKPPAPRDCFNLLICNPPYVRHHHIINGDKMRLRQSTKKSCGVEINGLAGLYCYFLGLSHAWMANDGLAGWLIPSEFMDVNYGMAVKSYLLEKVTLLHIHRFDPNEVQFGDALVSSAIVWFKKTKPPKQHEVRFTFGGSLEKPRLEKMVSIEALQHETKWTRFPIANIRKKTHVPTLADFFTIKRGLATGYNKYFILTSEEIEEKKLPKSMFHPILPSPRYLPVNEVKADKKGNPILDHRLFLLNCNLPEEEVKNRFPTLWKYLLEGKRKGVAERYLCSHRSPWYSQEDRPSPPFVCTYLGRGDVKSGKPYRFILNNSRATVANVYLALYPKPTLEKLLKKSPSTAHKIWKVLNEICPKAMLEEGRVYGGGLHKLEPKELAKVPARGIKKFLSNSSCNTAINTNEKIP